MNLHDLKLVQNIYFEVPEPRTMTSHDVEISKRLAFCRDINDFHIKKQKAVQTDKES